MATPNESPNRVTQLLGDVAAGKSEAQRELAELAYDQLRRIAEQRMKAERGHHTLSATALVHEAWMRLGPDLAEGDWHSRTHFYGAAANAMRRVLIDYARARGAVKRGGAKRRVELGDTLDLSVEQDHELVVALDEALGQLETEEPRVAEIVRLRFFAGLSVDDIAASLGVSRRTVQSDWSYARAWLFKALSDGDDDDAVSA